MGYRAQFGSGRIDIKSWYCQSSSITGCICHRYCFTIIDSIARGPLKVIVLFPLIAEVVDEKLRLLVIVAASLQTKYKTWCRIIVRRCNAVTEASVGADVSLDVCVQLNESQRMSYRTDVAPLNAPAATSM